MGVATVDVGAKRRRIAGAHFGRPALACDGSGRDGGGRPKQARIAEDARRGTGVLSFADEVGRLGGEASVRSADGFEVLLPHEVVTASPLLCDLVLSGSRSGRTMLLRHPDCTACALRRIVHAVRPTAMPLATTQDGPLIWPSEAAWSFFRCAAHLGVPAALRAAAAGVAAVLVSCLLEEGWDALRETFGVAPDGGLWSQALDAADDVDREGLEQVRRRLLDAAALGSRAGDAIAAALIRNSGSPIEGVGTPALFEVLDMADKQLLGSPDFVTIASSVFAPEQPDLIVLEPEDMVVDVFSKLVRLGDGRLHGSTFVSAAAAALLLQETEATDEGPERTDAILTILEATVVKGHRRAAESLSAWITSQIRKIRGDADRLAVCERVVALLARASAPGDPPCASAALAAVLSEDANWALHDAALAAMPAIAARGDRLAVAALASRLGDLGEISRKQALGVLEELAEPGDEVVLNALSACLSARTDNVRVAAVEALRRLCPPAGCPTVLAAAREILVAGDGSGTVAVELRATAVAALGAGAGDGSNRHGFAQSVSELAALLQDSAPSVRDAALRELSELSGVAFRCSSNTRPLAGGAAVDVMDVDVVNLDAIDDDGAVASPGGPSPKESLLDTAGPAMRRLLGHKSWSVRKEALLVFARLANLRRGDDACSSAADLADVADRLEDAAVGVRAEVPRALAILAGGQQRGAPDIVAAVLARLAKANNWPVRQAALAALAAVATADDVDAVTSAASAVGDEAKPVRDQAIATLEALCSTAPSGSNMGPAVPPVAALLAPLARHRDPEVRASAFAALGRAAPASQSQPGVDASATEEALRLLRAGLRDISSLVREKAVLALPRHAFGEEALATAIREASALLDDDAEGPRLAAGAALESLAERAGDVSLALAEARQRLDSLGQAARRSAGVAVARLEALSAKLLQCKVEGAKEEFMADEVPAADLVGQELRDFLREAKANHETDDRMRASDVSTGDEVGNELRMFLLEQKRRVGCLNALQVPSRPLPRLTPCVSIEGEIFRPPTTGEVKNEQKPEPKAESEAPDVKLEVKEEEEASEARTRSALRDGEPRHSNLGEGPSPEGGIKEDASEARTPDELRGAVPGQADVGETPSPQQGDGHGSCDALADHAPPFVPPQPAESSESQSDDALADEAPPSRPPVLAEWTAEVKKEPAEDDLPPDWDG